MSRPVTMLALALGGVLAVVPSVLPRSPGRIPIYVPMGADTHSGAAPGDTLQGFHAVAPVTITSLHFLAIADGPGLVGSATYEVRVDGVQVCSTEVSCTVAKGAHGTVDCGNADVPAGAYVEMRALSTGCLLGQWPAGELVLMQRM